MVPPPASERCLIVVAAEAEARAVLAGFGFSRAAPGAWQCTTLAKDYELLVSGVGKSNAAGSTAQAILSRAPATVLNLGICGALPHAHPLQVGEAVLASRCVFADEGIETPKRWIAIAEAGFPAAIESDWVTPAERPCRQFRHLADRSGIIATVSTCSGTNERAAEIARRCEPDGLAEAMEGAAVGLVSVRLGIPFAELRVASNRTGDRAEQGWDLPKALARLECVASSLAKLPARP